MGFVVYGVVIALAGAASLIKQLRFLALAVRSKTWLAVRGRVRDVGYQPLAYVPPRLGGGLVSGGRGMVATVKYTYEVNGETFESRVVGYQGLWAGSEKEAARIRNAYPRSNWVAVWYDPSDPQRAVLEPGPGISSFVRVAFSVIVLGLGIYLIEIGLHAA